MDFLNVKDEALLSRLFSIYASYQSTQILGESFAEQERLQQKLRVGTDELWKRLKLQTFATANMCPTVLQVKMLQTALTMWRYAGLDPEYKISAPAYELANRWLHSYVGNKPQTLDALQAAMLQLARLVLYEDLCIDEDDAVRWMTWIEESEMRWSGTVPVPLADQLLRLEVLQGCGFVDDFSMEKDFHEVLLQMHDLMAYPADGTDVHLVVQWFEVVSGSMLIEGEMQVEEDLCCAWMKRVLPDLKGADYALAEQVLTEGACHKELRKAQKKALACVQ